MRVAVEEAGLQQLHQEALLPNLDELLDLRRLAVRELLTIDPLGHEDAARRVLVVHARHDHVDHLRLAQHLGHPLHVRRLVDEIELRVKPHSPLV
jgi:hypothetical protein